ncbi:hypothetical protein [Massilia sp. BHUDP2]|uniref:hypothetical protein n=1 Tax=Massilia sp. BHUDP2 TaxID=3034505 RepID=UPI003906A05A
MHVKLISIFAVVAGITSAHAAAPRDHLSQLDKRYVSEKGKYGGPKFFTVPVVQEALATAVPRDWRRAMMNELVVETPNALVDGYLVVSACKPHFCPDKNYAATVRVADGAALFIVFDNDRGRIKDAEPQCFSSAFDKVSQLPNSVLDELRERSALGSIDGTSLGCAASRR